MDTAPLANKPLTKTRQNTMSVSGYGKILKSGVHERHELPPEDNPDYCALKISRAGTLATVATEYKLFSHGLLFTHGGWDRDPINDYLVEWGPEHSPFVIDLPRRVFFGMECKDERGRHRPDWCYKLLAIRHEGWEELFAFMSLVGAIQRDTGYVAKLLAQVISVPDILAMEKNTRQLIACSDVEVVVFGVDSNKRAVFCEPAKVPPLDKPKVKVVPPDPDTVELANRVLSDNSDPYEPIDFRFAEVRRAEAEKIISASRVII